MKFMKIFLLINVNFFGLWYLLSKIGIETFPPPGFQGTFGFVLPPYWYFLLVVFCIIMEYQIGTSLFAIYKNSKKIVKNNSNLTT